jgi:SAM-dependent methyltransferase
MGRVSGSTKPGGDIGSSSDPAAGAHDERTALVDAPPVRIAEPAQRHGSLGATKLFELCDRLAGEIVLRHAVGRQVLDLGHGAPEVTAWVRPRAASLTVVDAIDLGRGPNPKLSLRDGAFELVYSLRTLPHLGHDESSSDAALRAMLLEVARVLCPGGIALCQIDNPRSLWGAYHGIRHPANVIERGPLVVESERGVTRFDTVPRLLSLLPAPLVLDGVHGLRVFAAAPTVLAMPVVGWLVTKLEWFARDRAPLSAFGAHLLLVLRKAA